MLKYNILKFNVRQKYFMLIKLTCYSTEQYARIVMEIQFQ